MVDVTTEALETVKNALTTFQTDIAGISIRSNNNSENVMEKCKGHIRQTQSEVAQVESKISALNEEIADLETRIFQATDEYNDLILRIPQIQSNIHSLDSRISSLNSQIASLRLQLTNTEDDDLCKQIQDQIDALSYQVSQCESERNQLEDDSIDSEKKESELQKTIYSAKSQKDQCESELSVQKNRCNKLKDKLERLNTAYSRVEADLNAYVEATKKFESNSSDKARGNKNAVDKCITNIEEYLSINFSSGNGNVSASTCTSEISSSNSIMSCDRGEYHYESLANNGRHAYGQLQLVSQEERHRDNSEQRAAGGARRRNDDDGGHLIGARFGGATNLVNLFPQNRQFNRGWYRSMENSWERLLNEHNQVYVDIYTSSSNPQMREDAIMVSYTVVEPNGTQYTEHVEYVNENRAVQDSWAEDVFNNS